jgi:hypothetical protein
MLLDVFLLHWGFICYSTLKFWFDIVVFKLCECEISIFLDIFIQILNQNVWG